MLPFSRPSCYFKTRPPSCALGTSFYTVSEGRDLMTYVSDNYTSYSAPSPLSHIASCAAPAKATYSASAVESATHVCFLLCQVIAVPPI